MTQASGSRGYILKYQVISLPSPKDGVEPGIKHKVSQENVGVSMYGI